MATDQLISRYKGCCSATDEALLDEQEAAAAVMLAVQHEIGTTIQGMAYRLNMAPCVYRQYQSRQLPITRQFMARVMALYPDRRG